MPPLSGELDDGPRVVEEFDDAGPYQAPVELTHRIHATPQEGDATQVGHFQGVGVNEHPALRVFVAKGVDSQEVFGCHVRISNIGQYWPFQNGFV